MCYAFTKRQRFLLLTTSCVLLLPRFCGGFAFTDALVDFSLGAVAGGVGAFVAYPADYVTCQMQTESGKQKYKNGWDCFTQTVSQEGPLQLFRGVGVQLTGAVPEKAVKLGVNDMMKCWLTGGGFSSLSLFDEIVAASIAGVCQVVATSPLEVLKVGLQTSNSTMDELMTEIGGLPGLFRGAEACIVRDVLLSATLFPIYAHAHDVLPAFMAGSLAGVAVGVVGAPPDFIKTRILARDGDDSNDDYNDPSSGYKQEVTTASRVLPRPAFVGPQPSFVLEYRNDGDVLALGGGHHIMDDTALSPSSAATEKTETNPFVVAHNIIKREGWEVLFTGVTERVIASIPRYGVTLSLYDFLKVFAITHGWLGTS